MAKKAPADQLITDIIADIRFDRADAIVIIAIPSHMQSGEAMAKGQQSRWANAAMELFADLFGGATALRSYKGIYKSDDGKYLWDDTILIQGFTGLESLDDYDTIKSVVDFAKRMRVALDQEAVMV